MKTPPCHPELTKGRAHNAHRRALLASRRPTGPVGIMRAAGEPVTLEVHSHPGPEFRDPESGTACWQYRGGKHRICVFSGLRFAADALATVPAGITPDADYRTRVKPAYAAFSRAAVRHEVGHARFTCRDSARVIGELRRVGAPFRLFNLFEDVRIEAKERADRGPFRWTKAQVIPPAITDPRTWIWAAKTAETGVAAPRGAKWPKWTGPEKTAVGADSITILTGLFRECQHAPADREIGLSDVVTACAEFLRHFPSAASEPWPTDAGDPGDAVGDEHDGRCDPEPGEAGDGTPEPGASTPEPSPATPPPPPPKRRVDAPESSDGPGADEWAPCPEVDRRWVPERGHDPRIYGRPGSCDREPDRDLIRVLMARLGRIVHAVADRPAAIGEEGRGVYLPALAGGDPACWLRPAPLPGRPEICLVVDMSGSMYSLWHAGGREVVLAFRELARRGRIGLSCWLTGGPYPCRLPVHAPGSVWAGICPSHGVESYPDTLNQARADLQRARLAVCFSDGSLTDGDIDVSGWRARGVDLVGTCIAPATHAELMTDLLRRNFGRGVVDSSPVGLASQLAVALSRRR
jgi:hypothetical protein